MRVFVSMVGRRDPIPSTGGNHQGRVQEREDVPGSEYGPVMAAVRELKPDRVVLIGNEQVPIPANTQDTKEFLLDEYSLPPDAVSTVILPLEDPSDYEALYEAMGTVLRSIGESDYDDSPEFFVSLSSGTQQMSQVLTMLLDEGVLPGASRYAVRDPFYAHRNGKPVVFPITLDYTHESRLLQELPGSIASFQYRRASEACRTIHHLTKSPERRKKAGELAKALHCLTSWDSFEFLKALEHLKEIDKDALPDIPFDLWSRALGKTVSTSSNQGINEWYLADLFLNSKRRQVEGKLTFALIQFWQLYETLVNYMLERVGVFPDDLSRSRDPEALKRIKRIRTQEGKKSGLADPAVNYIHRYEGELLLDQVFSEDLPEWRLWRTRTITVEGDGIPAKDTHRPVRKWLEVVREQRNNAIHYVRPVRTGILKAAEVILKEAIDDLLKFDLDKHPMSQKKLFMMEKTISSL